MKRIVLIALVVSIGCLASLSTAASNPADCGGDVLPGSSATCSYRHVPFDQFSYAGGKLAVSWSPRYELHDVVLARDWSEVFAYRPGSRVQILFAPEARYDVVARFTDRRTGEEFLGLTPLSCRSRLAQGGGLTLTPAPLEGCLGDVTTGCRVTSETDCVNVRGEVVGSTSVECAGDAGTCSDACGDSEAACCSATVTRSEVSADGTKTSVTSIEQNRRPCD